MRATAGSSDYLKVGRQQQCPSSGLPRTAPWSPELQPQLWCCGALASCHLCCCFLSGPGARLHSTSVAGSGLRMPQTQGKLLHGLCSRGYIVTNVMAWCCKAHKTKASVNIRLSALVALALYSRIPAGISIRMTMTHYASAMSNPTHTATGCLKAA